MAEVGESASVCALDGEDIVFLARVHTPHLLIVPGALGSRLPAAATASGRVLLAALSSGEIDERLHDTPLVAHTHRSVVDPKVFRSLLESVRQRGWATVDEELELGLRAVAAPIRDGTGQVAAALGLSSSTSRVTVEDLHDRCLPALLRTAEQISTGLRAGGQA